jgi:predicted ribosome-associated RNA-binding protein Tma20
MRKIKLSQTNLNTVISKLQPSWSKVFDEDFVQRAQVAKSTERNNMFGILMNEKFIVLKKDRELQNPPVYAISDIYTKESTSDIAGLLIYRLGHPLVRNKPTLFIAE